MSVNWHRKDKVGGTGVLSGDCLSTDTKPTTVTVGSTLIETDTGDKYEFRGSTAGWKQTSFGGAVGVSLQNSAELAYPVTWRLDFSGVAGAADNAVIYTSPDVSEYNYHIIQNADADGAIDVFGSVDGENYSAVAIAVELDDDITTGGGVRSVTIPATKTGVIRGKYRKLQVRQNGATAITAGDVRGFHGVE